MNVEILDRENIRESVPVEIEISHAQGVPLVYIEGLGRVKLRAFKNRDKNEEKYMAQFWVMEKGLYQVTVRDKKEVWSDQILIKKQEYLSFAQEFNFFMILLLISSLGVVFWMKKIKQK